MINASNEGICAIAIKHILENSILSFVIGVSLLYLKLSTYFLSKGACGAYYV